jgi:Fe-S-cluster-containing dehydrogenase component
MLIDTDKCIYCRSCVFACKMENKIPHEWQRNDVTLVGPDFSKDPVAFGFFMNCNHCEKPACISSCPVPGKALYKRKEDGIVLVDKEKCNGCMLCVKACPYGVPRPTTFKNSKGNFVVDKCTFCAHKQNRAAKVEYGERVDSFGAAYAPACASKCPGRVMTFGDRDKLLAKVKKEGREVLDINYFGLNPSNIYLKPLPRRQES